MGNVKATVAHGSSSLQNAKEVADTFQKFKASERVKYFGVSNFPVTLFKLLNEALEEKNIKLTTEGTMVTMALLIRAQSCH